LVFANPRLSPEEIHQRYSPDYFWKEYLPSLGVHDGQYDLSYFDKRHGAMLELIERHAPRVGRLLEVGAGAGFFLKSAERKGWDVAGVELSAEAVKFASARLDLDVRREQAEQMTFPPASFDVVVMFDVVEHLLDPLVSLQRVGGALRPGGVLIISTPNFNALTRFALGANWAVLSPAEHLWNFSAHSLDRMLRRAGFSSVMLERRHKGFGVFETMNPRYTHAPSALRNKAYNAFVCTIGRVVFRQVQRAGLADTLIAIANSPRR
jgi:2-polyprenyl-3-methyl-5-hydroxy-6-metoxy-1,4-benzoquinol methylase